MEDLNFIDKNATQGIMIINGQTINLFDLQPRQVSMPKMVRGLQGVIRFNGYSDWSVAQHSFLLSHIVEGVCLQIMPSIKLKKLMGLEDVCDKLPISDKNLNEFLSFSKISINEIKSLSNEDFITAYIDRAVNISKRIKNEGEKRRK